MFVALEFFPAKNGTVGRPVIALKSDGKSIKLFCVQRHTMKCLNVLAGSQKSSQRADREIVTTVSDFVCSGGTASSCGWQLKQHAGQKTRTDSQGNKPEFLFLSNFAGREEEKEYLIGFDKQKESSCRCSSGRFKHSAYFQFSTPPPLQLFLQGKSSECLTKDSLLKLSVEWKLSCTYRPVERKKLQSLFY